MDIVVSHILHEGPESFSLLSFRVAKTFIYQLVIKLLHPYLHYVAPIYAPHLSDLDCFCIVFTPRVDFENNLAKRCIFLTTSCTILILFQEETCPMDGPGILSCKMLPLPSDRHLAAFNGVNRMSQFQDSRSTNDKLQDQFSIGETVRELLISPLSERRAAGFPKADQIMQAISLYVEAEVFASNDIQQISDTIERCILIVQRNSKRCGEATPNDCDALDIACRAVKCGLIDSTRIDGFPGASRLERLKHLCSNDDSLRYAIGTFVPPVVVEMVTPAIPNAETINLSSSATESKEENSPGADKGSTSTSRDLSTTVNRLAMLVSDNQEEQADAGARITALVLNNQVAQEDLVEFETIVSGGSKRDKNGNIIIRRNALNQSSSMLAIIELLESGKSPETVLTSLQVSARLDGIASVPDLADSRRVLAMTDSEYDRFLDRKRNLDMDTLEDFCDEFGFDINEAAGLNELNALVVDEDSDASLGIAEAIVFCIHNGEGRTVDDRVRSIIKLSKEHHELRGDFERIAELFAEGAHLNEDGEFIGADLGDEEALHEIKPEDL